MRPRVVLASLLILSLALFLGCGKSEHPVGEGEHPEGQAPAKEGEHPTEGAKEGEHPEGENKAGEHHTGHAPAKEGEHPEGEKKEGEHPEGEVKAAPKKPVTIAELAESIEAYVNGEVELKGGCFLVYDGENEEPLTLQLKKIHKDKLAKIEDQVYFACADFETPEGKVYDLDIFMKGASKGELKVTEITVHKESGERRYTWFEEGGIWKKKYAPGKEPKAKPEESEHPEHPTEHPE